MSATYSSLVLSSKPYAYYRLAEASGTTLNDASGNSRNGTISAAGITYAQTGAITGDSNKCLLFNGTTGDASMGFNASNGAGWTSFTVECWAKLATLSYSGSPAMIGNDTPISTNTGFLLQVNSNTNKNIVFALGDNSGHHGSANTGANFVWPSAGSWHHVVGTWDGSTITVYADGVNVKTASFAFPLGAGANNIGIGWQGANSFWNGNLDEVAIYQNTVLSATQVLEHYNVGLQANGGSGIYLVTTGSTILAQDLNQAIATLQQPAGGSETGKYVLQGNSYAIGAWVGNYIGSLSRNSTPVSAAIDTADDPVANLNAPATANLTNGGFEVQATSTAIVTNAHCGGNYTIQY